MHPPGHLHGPHKRTKGGKTCRRVCAIFQAGRSILFASVHAKHAFKAFVLAKRALALIQEFVFFKHPAFNAVLLAEQFHRTA